MVGQTVVDGQECFHIVARKEDMQLEIWIHNDALYLPVKYSISVMKAGGHESYVALFKDWVINPNLPDSMFEFSPPRQARKITMIPK